MKKTILSIMMVAGLALSASAAEVTVKGTGTCAKCTLGESGGCRNVIQVSSQGKTVNYYLAKNDISNKFHKHLCKGKKPVVAKGAVKKDGDKVVLTVSAIKLAE